jgi:cobalt/nickel transport system permease protein
MPFGTEYIGIVKGSPLLVIKLLIKAISLVSCLYYLSFNTPMIDILGGFSRLKMPPLIVELLGLIYRFIFIILAEVNVMFIAQRSRLGYSSWATSFRSLGSLVTMVFGHSYRRFDRLYIALESRFYEGTLNFLEEPKRAGLKGFLLPLVVTIFFVMLTIWIR